MNPVDHGPTLGFFESSDPDYRQLDAYDGSGCLADFGQNVHIENVEWVEHLAPQLQALESDAKAEMAKLEDAIAQCDDPGEKAQIRAQLDLIEDALWMLKTGPPGLFREPEEFRALFDERRLDLQNAIAAAGSARLGQTSSEPANVDQEIVARPGHGKDAPKSTGASRGDTGGVDAADYDPKAWPSYAEYSKLLTSDPEAARALLAQMGTEERSLFMQQIQQEMQLLNQMFTMMSNIAKTMHDTAKATIGNMRV